jgi:hypothetical protein
VIVVDRLLTGGIRFILDKVARAVDEEMNGADAIRQELLEAQMKFESGELSEEELAAIEAELMPRLRGASEPIELAGAQAEVEVSMEGDEMAPVPERPEPKKAERRPRARRRKAK